MAHYFRCRIAGGCYFFTVVTAGRRPILLQHLDPLRAAFRHVAQQHPFRMEAVVILPDHLHCLWKLPPGDVDYPKRWMLIKGRFTRLTRHKISATLRRPDRGERTIWQPRFWEHAIRDDEDFRRHLDYIHYNPVKHGYTASAAEWPHSSFKRFVDRGLYAPEWGAGAVDEPDLDCE